MLNHTVGSLLLIDGERVSVEVDVRSREKEERTFHMFVDQKQTPLFFYGLPESVKIGLLFLKPESIEFESFEELEESCAVEGGNGYKFEGEEVSNGVPDALSQDIPLPTDQHTPSTPLNIGMADSSYSFPQPYPYPPPPGSYFRRPVRPPRNAVELSASPSFRPDQFLPYFDADEYF